MPLRSTDRAIAQTSRPHARWVPGRVGRASRQACRECGSSDRGEEAWSRSARRPIRSGKASHGARKSMSSKCSSQFRFSVWAHPLSSSASFASEAAIAVAWPVALSNKANAARRLEGAFSNSASSLASAAFSPAKSLQNPHRVAQTGKNLWREDLLIGLFPQSGAERQQMSRKVAAVHTRHIERKERSQRAGLIPIVEMPAMPFESLHGGEGVLRASNQAAHRKIPEIPGGQIGEQRQAHIRGRGPRSDRRARALPGNCPAAASSPAR